MPRSLILVPGPSGQPKLLLAGPGGARAEVFLHGAQITSWIPADGRERLFLSELAEYAPGRAIRGGIPVIFPQVGGEGPLPNHGFARTQAWQPLEAEEGQAHLHLSDNDITRGLWPHTFNAELTVRLGARSLTTTLAVTNTGDTPLSFTTALHTYLRVEDVTQAQLQGLRGLRLRDMAQGDAERVEGEAEICFGDEVDRLSFNAPSRVELREGDRSTMISATGFPDLVLWNPGPIKGEKLRDLEPEGYRRMVCVEAAALGAPITLAPGQRWEGSQTLKS